MNPLVQSILGRRPWLANISLDAFGFSKASTLSVTDADIQLSKRLIDSYEAAKEIPGPLTKGDDVWSAFVNKHYSEMISLISDRNAQGLASYLYQLPRVGAGHGYFQGATAFNELKNNTETQRIRALWIADHLTSYAEATGLIRVRCPEQGIWNKAPIDSIESLVELVRNSNQATVSVPNVFDGLYGLITEGGTIHLRSLMANYAFLQLNQLMARNSFSVAEVGAGIGFTAYVSMAMGIKKHSIFDLPELNVAQGFFLGKLLGPDRISLFGEEETAPVVILPTDALLQTSEHFDVALNIDSLPEIDPSISLKIIDALAGCSTSIFSINQEAPHESGHHGKRLPTRTLMSKQGTFELKTRHPNWIRAGYVDEFFCAEKM